MELREGEGFIRAMDAILLHAKPNEEGRGAGDVTQTCNDGNGGTFPSEDRATGIDFAKDILRDAGNRGINGEAEARLVTGDFGEFDREAAGAVFLEVGFEALPDMRRGLVRHQTAGELGESMGRNDRLGSGTAVTAVDAIDLNGRAEGVTDDSRHAAFAADGEDADLFFVGVLVKASLGGEGEFCLGGVDDAVAEALDGDGTVGIVQGGDELGDALRGVGGQAAVLAGVKVILRPAEGDSEVDDTAQAGDDGRTPGGIFAGVSHQQDVRGETATEVKRLFCEEPTAALFLSLEDNPSGREFFTAFDGGTEALKKGKPLPFVVLRAAGIDAALSLGGSERLRLPKVDGVNGLDVVVPIEQDRTAGVIGGAFGQDERGLGTIATNELGGEAERAQEGADPIGAGDTIRQMRGVAADRREAQEGEIVGEDGGTIGREPGIEGVFSHDGSLFE